MQVSCHFEIFHTKQNPQWEQLVRPLCPKKFQIQNRPIVLKWKHMKMHILFWLDWLTSAGVYNLSLLPAALLLFIWSTGVNKFELCLWDTPKGQPTQNTFKHELRYILQLFVTSPSTLTCIVPTDFLTVHLFCFNIRQHGRQIL